MNLKLLQNFFFKKSSLILPYVLLISIFFNGTGVNPYSIVHASTANQTVTYREDFSTTASKDFTQNVEWDTANKSAHLSLTDGFIREQPVSTVDLYGNTYVAWLDYRTGGQPAVYLQKIDPAGNRLWNNDLMLGDTPLPYGTALLSDENGNIYVFWLQDHAANSSKSDIYFQGINSSGALMFPVGGKLFLEDTSQSGYQIRWSFFPKLSYSNGFI